MVYKFNFIFYKNGKFFFNILFKYKEATMKEILKLIFSKESEYFFAGFFWANILFLVFWRLFNMSIQNFEEFIFFIFLILIVPIILLYFSVNDKKDRKDSLKISFISGVFLEFELVYLSFNKTDYGYFSLILFFIFLFLRKEYKFFTNFSSYKDI